MADPGATAAAPVPAPYGSWSSPISPELIVAAAVSLGDVWVDGEHTWWSELRPSEAGRVELVRDGVDLLGPPWSARTRVHEYGGGAWWAHDGSVYFTEWTDQRLYRLGSRHDGEAGGSDPVALTSPPPAPASVRYADGRVSPDGRWLVCVRETHPQPGDDPSAGHGEVANEIVAIATDGSDAVVLLAGGHDFVAAPRISADGRWLAWVAWNHPNMPWDATELWVARFEEGMIRDARCVVGGPEQRRGEDGEAIVQPEWGPDGHLYFCSDRSNWWNLYRLESAGSDAPVGFPVPLTTLEADIALPGWVFGRSRYDFSPDGDSIVFAFSGAEHVHLGVLDLREHRLEIIETGLASFEALRVRRGADGLEAVGIGAGFSTEAAVLAIPLDGSVPHHIRPPATSTYRPVCSPRPSM